MKVLLMLLFFIQDRKTFAESNCSNLEVGLLIAKVEETSAQFTLTVSDFIGSLCTITEVNFTVNPEIYNGTCEILTKSCVFDNLKAFTNYTFTVHPIFNEGLVEGSPSSVTFFTAGNCLPANVLSFEFEGNKLKWLLNSTFTPLLNHYTITAEINRERTCGGTNFTYFEDYVLHNESIVMPNNVPGEWSICVKPHSKQKDGPCENSKCVTKYFPMEEHLRRVDKFSLTSSEKSLIAKWAPNSIWSQNCILDYYQIHSHPSPIGHSATINITCKNDDCKLVMKHFLPDTNYTIQITPIFSGNIRGEMDSRTEAPYSCPSAVSDLKIERNVSHLQLSWADYYENKADFYEITLFTRTPCGDNYSSFISVNVSSYSFVIKAISSFLDAKIIIVSSKRHDYNCPRVFIEKEIMPSQKIPLLVENLQLKNVTETSAEITWTHPSVWKTVCFPSLAYKVDFHVSTSSNEIKDHTDSSLSLWNLKPFTNYVSKVRACVRKKECADAKLSFTTMDIYPIIPEGVFSVDYQDLETLVDYQNETSRNANCSIRVTDVQSKTNYSFVCTNEGKIQRKDLPSGGKYEMEMKVCNSRGCDFSKPFIAYAAPTPSELPDVSVEASSLNSSIISLIFKSQNGDYGDYNGSMYIVVSEVEDQHPVANEVEVFVKRKSNVSAHGRSEVEMLPSRKHIIVESVPLDTLRYDIPREFLIKEGMETSNGIYVSPVIEYRSGGYSVVVAYDFCGPFKFGEIQPMSTIFWIIGSFGSIVGIVLLIVMFQRKFSPLPKSVHNGTKKLSFSTPTYESSQNNRDLDSECEKEGLNPDKVAQLQQVIKYSKTNREYDSN